MPGTTGTFLCLNCESKTHHTESRCDECGFQKRARSKRSAWVTVAQWSVQTMVGTACVIVVLLLMAQTPDMSEIKSGIPSGLLGAFGGWITGRIFKGT